MPSRKPFLFLFLVIHVLLVFYSCGLVYAQQEESREDQVLAVGGSNQEELATEGELPEEEVVVPSEEGGQNVTLDFKDADINNVLRILSLKSGVNIVAGPEVEGSVTIRLQDVPWEKALDVVLRTYGYVYERDQNIIRVTTRENIASEELVTETFTLNYTTAQEVEEAVKDMLSERGRIKSVTRTNTIIVTDVATNVFRISQVIKRLDKSTPQAYIDSKIVRTELGITENLGIDWNAVASLSGATRPTTLPFPTDPAIVLQEFEDFYPEVSSSTTQARNTTNTRFFPQATLATPTNSTFTFGQLNFTSFTAVLNLLKTRANTKIVSNPRIVVLNNQTAKVQVGEEIGIPTFERNETTGSFEVTGFEMRDVGVVLNVTPHINSADEILVDLKPEVSSFVGFTDIGTTNLSSPRFTTTEAQTQVLISDGETIAIGGLLTDNASLSETKVPWLGDIPMVGKFFRAKRETSGSSNRKIETLFFVTVKVVDSQGQPTQQISTPPGSPV